MRDVVPWSLVVGQLNNSYETELKEEKDARYVMCRKFV